MFEPLDVSEEPEGMPRAVSLADPVIQPDRVREERFLQLLRMWWCDERPAWTEVAWWDTVLRDDVRGLLWLPPGPLLVAALVEASTPGADSVAPWAPCPHPHAEERRPGWPALGHEPGWPCACQVVLAAAWEACAAWVAAGAAGALVGAAGLVEVHFNPGRPSPQLHDPAREELGVALRLSPNSMGNRIHAARDLLAHPELHALLASAGISAWGARIVVLELADLPEELTATLVLEVVDRVRTRLRSGLRAWTTAEIGRATRAVRLRRAPGYEQAARHRAWADRTVQVFPDRHGMATLHAVLDATDAQRIHHRLSAIAQGLADPDRTRDQVRADTVVDILLAQTDRIRDADRHPASAEGAAVEDTNGARSASGTEAGTGAEAAHVGGRQPQRPEINVVVSLATLLGLADDPAHVPGIGAVPADVARTLAADGRWRAWITDATGATVIATGTRTYLPGEALARLVRAREPHCRMPGCRSAAQRCDLDHTIPWPRGETTASNLGPLCRRHHVLKTHANWDLQSGHDSVPDDQALPGWTWRTPAGFAIRDRADPPLE